MSYAMYESKWHTKNYYKTRVKFFIGNYVDTVDSDAAPVSVCHLLSGRPCQFDLDAIHDGRFDSYSFVHKGVDHVVKLMPDSAIKAEVFATVKVKKKTAEISPKPRRALLREGEKDVTTSAPLYGANNADISSKDNVSISPYIIVSNGKCSHSETSIDNSIKITGGSQLLELLQLVQIYMIQ